MSRSVGSDPDPVERNYIPEPPPARDLIGMFLMMRVMMKDNEED
jgi:hypothetical protein